MSSSDAELWERFLAHAERALAKPTFDAEERAVKISVAATLRAAFASAREGGEWLQLVKQAFQDGLAVNMTTRAHRDWFKAWAAADAESLGGALAAFTDQGADAEEVFGAFASAAAEAEMKHSLGGPPGVVLALGSLFNFAVDTESLPLVRPWHFGTLEEILGSTSEAEAADPAAYPWHLQFAREVGRRLGFGGRRPRHDRRPEPDLHRSARAPVLVRRPPLPHWLPATT